MSPPQEESQSRGEGRLASALNEQLPDLRAFVRLNIDPFLRARESCSDLVQSACLELIEKNGSFEFRGDMPLRAWLYRAVLNKIREKRRYHLADRRSPGREAGAYSENDDRLLLVYRRVVEPLDRMVAKERVERFEQCFDKLPDDYREVMTWRYIVGLSQEEMAAQMNRSVASVRNLLLRARCRLATLLDRLEGAEEG